MQLTIVVPAYNEERRIGAMLDAYLPYFAQRYGSQVEVLVVINGSRDRTEEVVRSYEDRYSILRHLVEPRRVGKGGALMLGFQAARGDLVGFVDADGSTPPHAFEDLVNHLGEADVVIASRWRRDARVSPPQPWSRRLASRLFNLAVRTLFGLRLTDTQCGAKLMRRNVLAGVLPNLGITQWAFDVDLLVQLRRAGARIVELPTEWHDVAGSKVEIIRVSLEMMAALIRLRLLYSPLRWVVTLYDRYLAPFVHPAGVEEDKLFRHSLLLMAGAQVTNVGNLLFQVVAMWRLTRADYAVLAAMMGLFIVLTMPTGALSGTVTHFTAPAFRAGDLGRVRYLLIRLTRDLSWAGLILFAVGTAGLGPLMRYFRLDAATPLILTLVGLWMALYRPVLEGALLGAEAFGRVSLVGIVWAASRFALAWVALLVRPTAESALWANTGATAIAAGVALMGLRPVLSVQPPKAWSIRGLYPYFLRYAVALAGFSFLLTADAVFVKHYFPAEEAGRFGVAATVARLVVFLPQPISGAMFPKVVSTGGSTMRTRRILIKALILVGVIVLFAALATTAFAGPLLRVLTGRRSPEAVPLVRALVWAFAPLGLLFVLMNYELAQRRFVVALPLWAGVASYAVAVGRWHEALVHIVFVIGAAGVLATAGAVAVLVPLTLRTASGPEEGRACP